MIDVKVITDLQHTTVRRWHEGEIDNSYEGFLNVVCQQHEKNYRLWHQEDIARSRDVGDADLAQVKRNIDGLNQSRNDFIEKLDDCIIEMLAEAKVVCDPNTPLNTETPGSTIDRLSILSLRLYHMEEQLSRKDVDSEHRLKVTEKLRILYQQHADLSESLTQLINDLFAGVKRLKVYRQFKMYNDPTLNPYLYAANKKVA